jgi:hypothetical protein
MNRTASLTLMTAAMLSFAVLLPVDASAQQKQQVSYKTPAENSKYTQQLNVDVGDVPGHIVRIFEVHRTYPNNAPVINGLKLAEEWGRGIADYIDGNGSTTIYEEYVMDNGDKFFTRSALVAQNPSGRLTATQVGYITSGTGKFSGMHGIARAVVNFDPKTGFNESQTDLEYSIGK